MKNIMYLDVSNSYKTFIKQINWIYIFKYNNYIPLFIIIIYINIY